MRFLPSLPIRAVAAATLALGGMLTLPGGASASCGDYVHIQSDDVPTSPQPCRGPGCSKAPASPIVPMTVPVPSSGSDESSGVQDAGPDDRPGPGWAVAHTTSALPIRLTISIFHPPRAI